MNDTENKALYIAEQCRKAGMTLAGAAGVIANVEAESAFRSNNLQDCYNSSFGVSDETYTAQVDNGSRSFIDGAGYGLVQWTASDRKRFMHNFMKQRGKSVGDFGSQVDCIIAEMKNYGRAWNTCTTSNDPFECGYVVCKFYEIPADTENQANYRGNCARYWYQWLSDNSNVDPFDPEPYDPVAPEVPKDELRTIDFHCTGWPEVKLLQSALFCRGYNVLVDGIWTDELTKAVEAFQFSAGLDNDGVVGPVTWKSVLDFKY